MEGKINVFIIDDHQMFISGIRSIFEEHPKIAVVGSCTDGLKVLQEMTGLEINVALLDINLPGKDGLELNKLLRDRRPEIKVIALTMHHESMFIQKMIKGGAKGYIFKNSGKDQLEAAILEVASGGTWFGEEVKEALMQGMMPDSRSPNTPFIPKLSRREKEVLRLITQEMTTAEIADELFISQNTVETHRRNLLQKLDVRNTAGLVRFAVEKGLID